MNKVKSTKAITLVALVVTLVILLILAGISITVLFGDSGIIKTAQEAEEKWNQAMKNEQEDLKELMNMLNNEYEGEGNIVNPPKPPTVEIEEPINWDDKDCPINAKVKSFDLPTRGYYRIGETCNVTILVSNKDSIEYSPKITCMTNKATFKNNNQNSISVTVPGGEEVEVICQYIIDRVDHTNRSINISFKGEVNIGDREPGGIPIKYGELSTGTIPVGVQM